MKYAPAAAETHDVIVSIIILYRCTTSRSVHRTMLLDSHKFEVIFPRTPRLACIIILFFDKNYYYYFHSRDRTVNFLTWRTIIYTGNILFFGRPRLLISTRRSGVHNNNNNNLILIFLLRHDDNLYPTRCFHP